MNSSFIELCELTPSEMLIVKLVCVAGRMHYQPLRFLAAKNTDALTRRDPPRTLSTFALYCVMAEQSGSVPR